jgi:hypothetical protein
MYFIGALDTRPAAGKPVEAGGRIGNSYYRLAPMMYRPQTQETR